MYIKMMIHVPGCFTFCIMSPLSALVVAQSQYPHNARRSAFIPWQNPKIARAGWAVPHGRFRKRNVLGLFQPELRERDRQAGEQGGMKLIAVLAFRVDSVLPLLKYQASERASQRVENPVV